jgi:sec-independent protein translocase protein TatB
VFGLTFEKLFLVALVAGLVIGPQRLPIYTRKLAETLRSLKRLVEATRTEAERELGATLTLAEWEALDPRQYDPRRIVRDALRDERAEKNGPAIGETERLLAQQASRVQPGQKYLATGSAAHPRRILIDSLPPDDPRRIAAQPAAGADDEAQAGAGVSRSPAHVGPGEATTTITP